MGESGSQPGVEELLGRVAAGDRVAFEQLYAGLAATVYGLILRVLRAPALAEEVAQDVFVEVWRTATRFDPARGTGQAWLFTIAHHRAVDRVRNEQTSRRREEDSVQPGSAYDDVTEQVESLLAVEGIQRCLGALTDSQREAIGLAYYAGYSYSQVAERLGVPLGTVKSRMRDGLGRLRDCLTGVTEPDPMQILTGAYVLDALLDGEHVLFEAHLAGCRSCAREVGGLLEVTALLGEAVGTPAPEALRARVLAAIG